MNQDYEDIGQQPYVVNIDKITKENSFLEKLSELSKPTTKLNVYRSWK